MTYTPMTPADWERAMTNPEEYMIAERMEDVILAITESTRDGEHCYKAKISREFTNALYINDDGYITGFMQHFTRRPEFPPLETPHFGHDEPAPDFRLSQAREIGAALVGKSTDFKMPITKADQMDIVTELHNADKKLFVSEQVIRNRLAELIPHYYIAEMHLDGALISLRLEVLGCNRLYQCITDDRKTGIMYLLLKVLEDAK